MFVIASKVDDKKYMDTEGNLVYADATINSLWEILQLELVGEVDWLGPDIEGYVPYIYKGKLHIGCQTIDKRTARRMLKGLCQYLDYEISE